VGVLVGAAALMRWQLVTFAVLPFGEGLLFVGQADSWGEGWAASGLPYGSLAVAALGRC